STRRLASSPIAKLKNRRGALRARMEHNRNILVEVKPRDTAPNIDCAQSRSPGDGNAGARRAPVRSSTSCERPARAAIDKGGPLWYIARLPGRAHSSVGRAADS